MKISVTKMSMHLAVLTSAITACTRPGQESPTFGELEGTYVRIIKTEITNPESGKVVGNREIRDSILIRKTGEGYKVTNRKWRKNDYDQEGWISMAHSDNRPLPDYEAEFDPKSNTLNPKSGQVEQILYVDPETGYISKDQSSENEFARIP